MEAMNWTHKYLNQTAYKADSRVAAILNQRTTDVVNKQNPGIAPNLGPITLVPTGTPSWTPTVASLLPSTPRLALLPTPRDTCLDIIPRRRQPCLDLMRRRRPPCLEAVPRRVEPCLDLVPVRRYSVLDGSARTRSRSQPPRAIATSRSVSPAVLPRSAMPRPEVAVSSSALVVRKRPQLPAICAGLSTPTYR